MIDHIKPTRLYRLWFYAADALGAGLEPIEFPGDVEIVSHPIPDSYGRMFVTIRADWLPVVPIGSEIPSHPWHGADEFLRAVWDEAKGDR